MSNAKNETIPDQFDVDGEYLHLQDKITSDAMTKRTLKNGLLEFLRENHPDDFVKEESNN